MDKMGKKAKLLKMLAEEMMGNDKEESMEKLHGMLGMDKMSSSESKCEMDDMEDMSEEAPMKATIMAKDEKGLIEGAKKLPEILSKAEAFKKLRFADKKKKK